MRNNETEVHEKEIEICHLFIEVSPPFVASKDRVESRQEVAQE